MTAPVIDRRGFLVTSAVVGGGMALGLSSASAAVRGPTLPWGPDVALGSEFTPWIEIAPDDTITVRVPTPECGNGAFSQAAMNVAEELQCDWSKVRVAFASYRRDLDEKGSYQTGFLSFFSGHSTGKDRLHLIEMPGKGSEPIPPEVPRALCQPIGRRGPDRTGTADHHVADCRRRFLIVAHPNPVEPVWNQPLLDQDHRIAGSVEINGSEVTELAPDHDIHRRQA